MSEQTGSAPPIASGTKRRWLLAALPLLVFLALAAIFWKQLAAGGGSTDIPSVLIDRPAPQFELAPLEGLAGENGPIPGFSTADLKGKVSIVNVWASWCAPCRTEHPLIVLLGNDERITVRGLNYKDNTANALRFLGQLGNPFETVGVDPRGKAAIEWGVYGVPETFIVDAQGIVRYKHVGPLTPENFQEKFLPELEKAIAVPTSPAAS